MNGAAMFGQVLRSCREVAGSWSAGTTGAVRNRLALAPYSCGTSRSEKYGVL